MLQTKNFSALAVAAFTCFQLSACGNIQTIVSFSTPYEQPESGDRARIRVISYHGMIRAVPNSDCIDWRLPGAGVMVSSTKGFANVNDRDLGMPSGQFKNVTTTMGRVAVSELYVPAGKPISLHYLSQGDRNYQCFVAKSFVPVANADYEAAYAQDGKICHSSIVRLAQDGGVDKLLPVKLNAAPLCRASDIF